MFETIIVPLDGSELAELALGPASEIAKKFGSKLILLRAVEPASHRLAQSPMIMEAPAAAAMNVELLEEAFEAERKDALEYLAAKRGAQPVQERVEDRVVEGEPVDAILDAAKQSAGSLIVMSTHGRTGLARIVFGSVADAVLRRSPVPVLLIPSFKEREHEKQS
jgi:nucleotide-binding universal stress UspA family protein